jgi:acid phosphatase (class A)
MTTTTLSKFVLSALFVFNFTLAKDVAKHTDTEPVYIQPGVYEILKSQLPKPPTENSKEQKADELEIRKLQKNRTAADCAQANLEANADFAAMFGEPKGPLNAAQVNATKTFFIQVRSDISPIIGKLKSDFPRKRPFLYLKDIEPCVPKDDSGAFPSGHGAIGQLCSLILADVFPQHADKLKARGLEVGRNRIMAGVHHPTDIEAGRKLGELLYGELKKSKKYQDDLAQLQAAVKKQ